MLAEESRIQGFAGGIDQQLVSGETAAVLPDVLLQLVKYRLQFTVLNQLAELRNSLPY